jgi:hypothetical protein
MKKVFAFFGADIADDNRRCLHENVEDGYSLLALDAAAIRAATIAELPFTLIDDWIDTNARRHARETALACHCKWYIHARQAFTVDGICWPEFDRNAMFGFWQEVFVGMALIESFRQHRLTRLKFYQHEPKRPCIHNEPADCTTAIWGSSHPDLCEIIPKAKSKSEPARFSPRVGIMLRGKKLYWGVLGAARSMCSPRKIGHWKPFGGLGLTILQHRRRTNFSGKAIIACYDFEFFRFELVMRQLVDAYPGGVAAVATNVPGAAELKVPHGLNVPVASGPAGRTSLRTQKLFTAAYQQALTNSIGSPWHEPLSLLDFHFHYYCVERWPRLVSKYRLWRKLWKQVKPSIVMVSSNVHSESQLPAAAAQATGIPTYSIPHGAVDTFPETIIASHYILCDHLLQKETWRAVGIPNDRLLLCRGVVPEHEYPVKPVLMDFARGACRLVALTDPVSYPSRILGGSHKAQLDALAILARPPENLREKVNVVLKLHPHSSELDLYAAVDKELQQRILLNTDLIALLTITDLVVSVNYLGSALIHVMRAQKPVIFLWTDPLMGQSITREYAEFFLQAGILARTEKAFWGLVSAFISDHEFAGEMRRGVQKFATAFLDNSAYSTVDKLVRLHRVAP